jgi:hypothetical protein
MNDFTTDNIDRLEAEPLDWPGGWRVTFRSAHSGMHHQVYLNGCLADWTDHPDQRSFLVQADGVPRQVVIAAVSARVRSIDMSSRLAASFRQPGWVYRVAIGRSPRYGPGTRLAIHGDHAAGRLDPAALDAREVWPPSAPRWAWGEDLFGMGGFGYDGTAAPGLGMGAFGAGLFGLDEVLVYLAAALAEDGEHRIVLRAVAPDGSYAQAEPITATAHPPPLPAGGCRVSGYDAQTDTLTLQIE